MGYWQKRKLIKIAIYAALIIGAFLGVRELLRPDAKLVTVKYVEDLKTFQSVSTAGGYTNVVTTDDRKMINKWIDLMLAVEKCDKSPTGSLEKSFPCYIIEYRLGKNVWVAMLQITETGAGRAYQFIGDDVFVFGEEDNFFERAGELMAKTEEIKLY